MRLIILILAGHEKAMAYPFVVFEGVDGSGKETQVQKLALALRRKRVPVRVHKYPTQQAGAVQGHLDGTHPLTSDELFRAFVADLLAGQARLASDRKKGWVLADRYCISTAAYQGVEGKLEDRIRQLQAKSWITPDLVLWLDLPVEEGMRRKAGQKLPDRNEADRAFLEQVRTNYGQLYRMEFLTANWERVDASQPPDKVAAIIRKTMEK